MRPPYFQVFPISSIIYRLLMLAIGMSITFNQVNIWGWGVYAGIFGAYYIFIFIAVLLKWVEMRTVLDFTVIILVLWGKSIDLPINYFFILFPLINSVFYSGQHRSIATIVLFTAIAVILISMPDIRWSYFIPVLVLYFISYIYDTRRRWVAHSQELSIKIDDFFCQSRSIDKPHKMYPEIIDSLNKYISNKKEFVNNICVYVIKPKDKVFLLSSSVFLWTREILMTPSELESLRIKKKLVRVDPADSKIFAQRFYYVQLENEEYIVSFDMFYSPFLMLTLKIGLERMLQSLSGKIVRFLDMRHMILEQRSKEFLESKQTKDFIDNAINVMHFTRNKLNPIKNLIAFDQMDEDHKNESMLEIYPKLVGSADRALEDITHRANQMLDPLQYPFSELEIQDIPLQALFTMLSETTEAYFNDIADFKGKEPPARLFFKGNRYDIKVMFTDWVSNMKKYGTHPSVTFSFIDNTAEVTFINVAHKEKVKEVIGAINNQDVRSRHTRKETHGISSLKEIARDLDITLKAEESLIENDNINSTLKLTAIFPLYGKENIDN